MYCVERKTPRPRHDRKPRAEISPATGSICIPGPFSFSSIATSCGTARLSSDSSAAPSRHSRIARERWSGSRFSQTFLHTACSWSVYAMSGGVAGEWRPEPHHLPFEGVLNGGICGALLDCHSNWTAAHHLMKASGASTPPCTVTADFHVTLKRPTPMDVPLTLRAKVVESH